MAHQHISVVTGAFGFSGKYIAGRLLEGGERVRTLTNSPPPRPLPAGMEAAPLDFTDPGKLAEAMRGASVLYNTFWVRFPHGGQTHRQAVQNSRTLIAAAREAGVRRIVHVSVANPSLGSPLSYFRGKAEVEEAIRASDLSYAILRPAVLFGSEDILINNIAWLLRKAPVFAIPGDGRYHVQPTYVGDLAALAVAWGGRSESAVLDAVGPEVFTYEELVRLIARVIGGQARVVHVPPAMVLAASRAIGWGVGDVVLTREEIQGLMADLLVSSASPTCTTRLSDWLREHAASVGRRYASEVARHFERTAATKAVT